MKPLFQSEEIERYYATWAYLGVINGKDAYCKQGRHGYPLLSLQPSLEMCEYISPAHYTMVAGEAGKSLRWYKENSPDTYELIIQADKALGIRTPFH